MPKSESDGRSSKTKTWVFRLIACGVPCVAGAIAIICVLFEQERLSYDPQQRRLKVQFPPLYLQEPGHERTGHRYVYDARLGWRNIPNWKATTQGRPLTINSRGLRDREYSYKKPPGVSRMLVLGDSYAWGYGVADEEVFSEVLEKNLPSETQTWEVLNAGVSGWGTDQEYLFLIDEGLKYSPDVVLLAFFLVNDPNNNRYSRQYGLNKPVFLNTDLELANVPVPLPRSGAPTVESQADSLELTAAIIEAMARRCDQLGCPLVVTKFGRFLDWEKTAYLDDERRFETLLQQRLPDVPYLDLDEAFLKRSISSEQLLVGNDDGHWNAEGHRLTAEILSEFLGTQAISSDSR